MRLSRVFCRIFVTFTDRIEAGRAIAGHLAHIDDACAVVLGLARGGVIVAHEVAKTLRAPLDVLLVKKIPSPENCELALGAVAPDGIVVIDWPMVRRCDASTKYIQEKIDELAKQIREKILIYRKGKPPLLLTGKTVILIDDGAATGSTFEAAVAWARHKHAQSIIGAVPVAPPEVAKRLSLITNRFITIVSDNQFRAVGQYYLEFPQVDDQDLIRLLQEES
jgi:predicted phosphoribosyltransferase